MSLYRELKRRNVFRVAIAYLALAWLVTEVAGTVFPAFGIPDWGVRFFVIAFALGFVPALIISWVYEITPEGLKREKDVVREASITHLTAKRLDVFTIGVVVVALAFILADRLWLSPQLAEQSVSPAEVVTEAVQTPGLDPAESQYPPKSIAVLPFADLSESQDQGWFADGLAEEILNTLVRTPDLMVSSRTSSFKYRNSELNAPGIAKELGVAHILEGSVRRDGDRIRVTAQLIRAGDGFHVWSEHFDRIAEDVISIQEDLATNIAKALKTTMDPVVLEKMLQAGTRSVEAYEHYLKGLASLARRTETSDHSLTVDALDHFEMARELDPGFAAAHTQSAGIWGTKFTENRLGGSIDVTFQQAFINFREAMIAAIENAPDETQRKLYEAILANNELRSAEAVQLLRRVLEKFPNSLDATIELVKAAGFSLDAEAYTLALNNLLRLGDIVAIDYYLTYVKNIMPSEQHVASVLEQVRRFPNAKEIIYQAHRALLWAGEFEEAHKLYPRLGDDMPEYYRFADARQACSLGQRDEAEKILRIVQKEDFKGGGDQWHILVLLGEHEAAARALKAYESGEVPMRLGAFLSYPQFDPRPFPTLMSILEREGLDWPPPREIPFACPPKVEE